MLVLWAEHICFVFEHSNQFLWLFVRPQFGYWQHFLRDISLLHLEQNVHHQQSCIWPCSRSSRSKRKKMRSPKYTVNDVHHAWLIRGLELCLQKPHNKICIFYVCVYLFNIRKYWSVSHPPGVNTTHRRLSSNNTHMRAHMPICKMLTTFANLIRNRTREQMRTRTRPQPCVSMCVCFVCTPNTLVVRRKINELYYSRM